MRLRPVFQSLVFRLILLGIGLVVLGSWTRYYVLSDFIREDIAAVVAEQQTTLANYVARDIGHQVFLRKARLHQLAQSLGANDPRAALQHSPQFGASAPFEALFSAGLVVIDAEGRVLVNSTRFDASWAPADVLRDVAAALPDDDPVVIGRPVRVGGKGMAVLPMTIALRDSHREAWGYLTGFTYLQSPTFLGNLLDARLGQSGSGFLVISPSEALFVAASNRDKVLTATPPAGVNALHDRAMRGFRGVGITTNAHGVEEISAMVSVPNTDWFLVSAIATDEALGTVARVRQYLFRNTVLMIGLLAVVLALAISMLLRPLILATRKADQMSRGLAPLAPLPGAGSGEIGVLIGAFNRLLSRLDQQQLELARAANHDSLTGLPNRRLLTERLAQALTEARVREQALALVFLDLDRFKPINDTLGHDAGDRVLVMVAQRLVQQVRDTDCVARLGGDEFVVLLTDLSRERAQASVERIVAGLLATVAEAPYLVDGRVCRVGLSTGAVISQGADTPAQLMQWADQLMYLAKSQGGDRNVVQTSQTLAARSAPAGLDGAAP